MDISRFIGSYHRQPADLPHHRVRVEENGGQLVWKLEGEGTGWSMTISSNLLLLLGKDCPIENKRVIVEMDGNEILGLVFNNEFYAKQDDTTSQNSAMQYDDDSSGGAVVEGDLDF